MAVQQHHLKLLPSSSSSSSSSSLTCIARAVCLSLALLALIQLLNSAPRARASLIFYDDNSADLPREFVQLQNEARAEVGVPPLQWNSQLASYAQWWANQNAAFGDCGLHHSGGPYGENIFWGNGKDWSPLDAVSDWANEKRWYNYWANSCLYYDACGHYTQIVWKTSRYVGCARVTCADGNIFMTCNYYPPGNYIGQRPY